MSKILGRDDIMNADDTELIPVDVPEWGGTVMVKPLTGNERDAYESSNWRRGKGGVTELDLRGSRARLAQMAMVDESGNRLFGKEDVEKLGLKSAHALDRVVEAARESSGIADDQVEGVADSFSEETPQPDGEPSYTG
jgi:hypothetical protein